MFCEAVPLQTGCGERATVESKQVHAHMYDPPVTLRQHVPVVLFTLRQGFLLNGEHIQQHRWEAHPTNLYLALSLINDGF